MNKTGNKTGNKTFMLLSLIITASLQTVFAKSIDNREQVNIYFDLEPKQGVQFLQRPYLEQVLNQLPKPWELYWPAAALYSLDSGEPEIEKQRVIAKLQQLEAALDATKQLSVHKAIVSLREQIESWVLYRRVSILLDYDWVRIRTEYNPRFDAGNYWLKTGARPTTVAVIGAAIAQESVKHQGAAPVFKYMKLIKRSVIADINWVFAIQASGEIQKIPVALWNRNNDTLRPGSTIYIPLDVSKLPKKFATINDEIVHLLNYWVAP